MSIVIVGGNERMVRQYKDLCSQYNCDAKVFTKMREGMRGKIGSPDMMVMFTSTMSHTMMRYAISETKGQEMIVARSKSSSMSALRNILEEYALN